MPQIPNSKYHYNEDELLGQGAFSRVFRGHHLESGRVVAIKVMELSVVKKHLKHLLQEIQILTQLNHPHIVQLYDVVYERMPGRSGLRLYIIMEYCEAGDLGDVEKPIPEERCRRYFREIMLGLRYLREKGYLHRDIKPKNILRTTHDVIKIADFTFAREVEQEELLQTMCGTPLYMAPEIFFGDDYGVKCDLWSLGVMLYEYLYGTHPFGTIRHRGDLMKKMKGDKIQFPKKLILERYIEATGTADETADNNVLGTKDQTNDDQDLGEKDEENNNVDRNGKDARKETQGDHGLILERTIHVFSNDCLILLRGLLKRNQGMRFSWEDVYSARWLNIEDGPKKNITIKETWTFGDRPSGKETDNVQQEDEDVSENPSEMSETSEEHDSLSGMFRLGVGASEIRRSHPRKAHHQRREHVEADWQTPFPYTASKPIQIPIDTRRTQRNSRRSPHAHSLFAPSTRSPSSGSSRVIRDYYQENTDTSREHIQLTPSTDEEESSSSGGQVSGILSRSLSVMHKIFSI